jgi:hypothetical protein
MNNKLKDIWSGTVERVRKHSIRFYVAVAVVIIATVANWLSAAIVANTNLSWLDPTLKVASLLVALIAFSFASRQLATARRVEMTKSVPVMGKVSTVYTHIMEILEDPDAVLTKEKDKEHARDFVRFAESTMVQLDEGVITIEEVFPILGYRFLTFLNHPWIREQLLKQGMDRHAARSCGAYALYERLFAYLIERFSDRIPVALAEFNHFDYGHSLYWDADFTGAVSVYYTHKPRRDLVVQEAIPIVRQRVKRAMASIDGWIMQQVKNARLKEKRSQNINDIDKTE